MSISTESRGPRIDGRPAHPQLISVIVACLNAASTLRECLQSVVTQQGNLCELIVMDGGSTDGTLEIAQEFRSEMAHFESKADGGPFRAWNSALDYVRGEWVYFLGADDRLWSNDVFTRISPTLEAAAADVQIVYGRVAMLDETGAEVTIVGRPWAEVSDRFFHGGNLFHQGVFHRRGIFEKRAFDTSFPILADYELLLDVLSQSKPLFESDVIVAGWRAGGQSSRRRNAVRVLGELDRALARHGHPRTRTTSFLHYIRTLVWVSIISVATLFSRPLGLRLSRILMLRGARGA